MAILINFKYYSLYRGIDSIWISDAPSGLDLSAGGSVQIHFRHQVIDIGH